MLGVSVSDLPCAEQYGLLSGGQYLITVDLVSSKQRRNRHEADPTYTT